MRIKNRYIRNRSFRLKYWKSIRNKSHPFETFCPYDGYDNTGHYHNTHYYSNDVEAQVARHFEWILEQARALESGTHRGMFNAPKEYRKLIQRERKAQERAVMHRIDCGDYEAELPIFKRDANWRYF